jgi:hypothetical protein
MSVKHTLLSRSLNLFAAFSIFCGIGLTGYGAPLYASITPDGAARLNAMLPEGAQLYTAAPAAINPYQAADAAIQLTTGILLIVLGFFAHGLSRMRSERPVHITIKKSKRRRMWYWMEMSI